jgi:putative cardiolipin synthase
VRSALIAALATAAVAGCAAEPPIVGHRPISHALATPGETALGRLMTPAARAHPGLSGFALLASGRAAYEGRYALATHAQKTIDVQYFLWQNDASGRLLLAALIDAARRGVRVRILLDDLHVDGRDAQLAALDGQPNIAVRLFNPFLPRWTHLPDLVFDFARVNHRMHNKAFIVDNAVAIVGGRNIGDPYFSVSEQGANFRDLDLFAAGPIVGAVSAQFDSFWNSPWAVSVGRLDPDRPEADRRAAIAAALRRSPPENPRFPFTANLAPQSLDRLVRDLPARLTWGRARLIADGPDKPMTSDRAVVEAVRGQIERTATHDLLIESAYFVPADGLMRNLCALAAQHVKVRILTNSLASNDATAAFAGYAKHRKDLLRCGVALYELRADAGFVRREWTWLTGRSLAMLHSKATVIDGRGVIIGSFNMDPRSAHINTEMALLIDSPELAAETAAIVEHDMQPGNAWRLTLDRDGDIVWTGETAGRAVRQHQEPDSGFWLRMRAKILSLLPIDRQL